MRIVRHKVTVRQLYYQAEVHGIHGIDKTDAGYHRVQRQVLNLRRSGRLPYNDIADLTRWMRKPKTYSSMKEALENTAYAYRRALWDDQEAYVEVWTEKDALAQTKTLCKKLRKLQTSLYCEKQRSVLIVLQALDTAGKDGVINHVLGAMNPLSCPISPPTTTA